MFAFHQMENGGVDFIGEIFSEANGVIRLQLADSFMVAALGMWSLTDEVRDLSKSECRVFLDEMACLGMALEINLRILAAQ